MSAAAPLTRDDLYRYVCPVPTGRPVVEHPWTVDLPDGQVITVATNGSGALVIPGTVPGVEPLGVVQAALPSIARAQASAIASWVEPPSAIRWTAPRGPLAQWAGSPHWPRHTPRLCPTCEGAGESRCDAWNADRGRCSTVRGRDPCAKLGDVAWACDGRPECPDCTPRPDLDLGWLGPELVDRILLARLLDALPGPLIQIAQPAPATPSDHPMLYLVSDDRWAVLMPCRTDRPDAAALPRCPHITPTGAP